ncbi:hypothetical protein [Rhizobium sp. Leaf311]|nr:hypothetical protein [Rhizobium sp. Leaf311]
MFATSPCICGSPVGGRAGVLPQHHRLDEIQQDRHQALIGVNVHVVTV